MSISIYYLTTFLSKYCFTYDLSEIKHITILTLTNKNLKYIESIKFIELKDCFLLH